MQNATFFDVKPTTNGANSLMSSVNDESGASEYKSMTENESIQRLLEGIAEETKDIILQFETDLSSSIEFEQFCLDRLDKLIKDANEMEDDVKQQKSVFCARAQQLAKTLQEKYQDSQ